MHKKDIERRIAVLHEIRGDQGCSGAKSEGRSEGRCETRKDVDRRCACIHGACAGPRTFSSALVIASQIQPSRLPNAPPPSAVRKTLTRLPPAASDLSRATANVASYAARSTYHRCQDASERLSAADGLWKCCRRASTHASAGSDSWDASERTRRANGSQSVDLVDFA